MSQNAEGGGGAPKPSKELLGRLGLTLEQWEALPNSEKRERLLSLLKANQEATSGKSAAPQGPVPESRGGRPGPSSDVGLTNYFKDDDEVTPTPVPMLHLQNVKRQEDIAKEARILGRRSSRASLGFEESAEEPES